MKKKLVYLSLLFMGLFVIGNKDVYAYQKGAISYDIESMDVSNDRITFSGWAIAHDVNNVGGVSTKISIVATDGVNSIKKESTGYKENNLYLGLCNNDSNYKCTAEYLNTCHSGASSNSQYEKSCIYRNVAFSISFSIKELKEKFNTSNIKFRLQVDYNESCKVNSSLKTYSGIYNKGRMNTGAKRFGITCGNNNYNSSSTLLGVHTNVVKKNGADANVVNGKLEINKGYYFSIRDISDNVNIIDSDNKVQKSSGVKHKPQFYFRAGANVINPNMPVKYSNTYQVKLYAIKGYGKNGNTYALASWLETVGDITLQFEPKEEDIPEIVSNCPVNRKELGGACVWDNSTNKGRSNTTTLNYNGTTCKTYSSEVHYQSKYSSSQCMGRGVYEEINGGYYLKSSISSTVNFTQKGTLTYMLGPNTIHSGGATQFSVTYTNDFSWAYKDRYYYNGFSSGIHFNDYTDYYGYTTCGLYSCTDHCDPVDVSASEIAGRIRDGESFLNKDKKVVRSGEEIIETYTANDYDKNFLGTLNSSYSIGVPANDIQGYWTGTNASIGTRWNGSNLHSTYIFNLYDAYINRVDGTVTYNNSGNNIYIGEDNNEYLYRPKNYFIPLDFYTGKYNFKYSISDLSSMRGGSNDLFKWTNNYTCDVNCEQKFYGKKDGYYFKYRPIDLNNVFPRNNAGFQWRQWMESDPIGVTKVKSNGTLVLDDEKELNLETSLNEDRMNEIRKYNNDTEHLGGYLNDSIDLNGKSNFLKRYTYTVSGGNYKLGCGSLNEGRGECQ